MARLGGIDTQYFTDEGDPLSYGLLYCYETGTTTPKGTFHDSDLTVPNTWPIELDAIGVPPDVFFSGTAKFVLKDSAGATLRTLDPVIDNEFQTGDTVILRLGDIDSQFFDQNGEILSLGKLYVYENGTSTPKDTYSDNALTTLNDWPVELDSTGFLGDVFFEGKARLVLTDQYGVQQRELDDVDTFDISYIPGFIADCPDSAIVRTGEVVTFCVYVVGDVDSYTYQWYQGLTAITGETDNCIIKTIVAGDDGTSLWVTVSDGSSTEQCAYALITIDDVPCEWTAPSGPITADLIWREEDGGVSDGGIWGILGTDGAGRLIANPTGRKIITSDDYGDTWTEYATACPDSVADPGGGGWLAPRMWQYFYGKWRTHLLDNSEFDGEAFAADFVSGTFTFGVWNDDRGAPPTYDQVGLRNGRYSYSSMHWDANGVVALGRWGGDASYPGTNLASNNCAAARYGSFYGENSVPSQYRDLLTAGNGLRILPLSDGYFAAVQGAAFYGFHVNYDLSASDFAWFGSLVNRENCWTGNGDDTVIHVRSSTRIDRWTSGSPPVLDIITPNTGGTLANLSAWTGSHWLIGGATPGSSTMYTSYTTGPQAASFTTGPTVTLPASVSAAGNDSTTQNILYVGLGVWVGFYIRATDRKIDIYRFTYGTLEGNCD